MQLQIFIGMVILGGLLNFIKEPNERYVRGIALGYLWLALLLSLTAWVFYFAGIKNTIILGMLSLIMSWGGALGHLALGYLIVNVLVALKSKDNSYDNYQLKNMIRPTLWGISILVGNSFIIATTGKAQHMAEMLTFFNTSGYANWFLYFIMTAEALGGLGVLLHFKLKTGPLAAAGLMLIMLGAVYTHWHNHDPFSDSYAAVGQLINLSLLHILYYSQQQANLKTPETTIYIV
ncbi:MAG TPA: DoxX family protein [Mucilaginibacter sp.]|nr:DoxX family protein [Mucilaginibacter sp.]